MSGVTVYSKAWCPFCIAARTLLERKGVAVDVIDIGEQPALRDEMLARSGGRRTVPQIFVADTHVGGYDDLEALDRAGRLDPLLEAAAGGATHSNTESSTHD